MPPNNKASQPKPFAPEPLLALSALPALSAAAVLVAAPRMSPDQLAGLFLGASVLFLLPAVMLVALARSWPPLILTAEEADRSLFTRLFWHHLVRAFIIGTLAAPMIMLIVGLLGRPAGLDAPTRLALANYLMAASWALPFLAAVGVLLAACSALGARRATRIALILAAVITTAGIGAIAWLNVQPLTLAFAAGMAAPCFAIILALAVARAVIATGHLSHRRIQTADEAMTPMGTAPRGPVIWPTISTGIAFTIIVGIASRGGEAAAITAGVVLGPLYTLSMLTTALGLRRAAGKNPGSGDAVTWVVIPYLVLTVAALALIFLSGTIAAALFPTMDEGGQALLTRAMRVSALLLLLEPVSCGLAGLRPSPAQRVLDALGLWLIALPAIAIMIVQLELNAVTIVLALAFTKALTVLVGVAILSIAGPKDEPTPVIPREVKKGPRRVRARYAPVD